MLNHALYSLSFEAEHDKSCPYGWRMATDYVFRLRRNVMNHAPTAGA